MNYLTYDFTNAWPGGDGGAHDRAGIDFDVPTIAASSIVSEFEPTATVVFDAKSIVQYWADGNLNAGLAIQVIGNIPSNATALNWWSREKVPSELAPVLEFEYVPEPSSAVLLALGALVFVRSHRSA